MIKQDTPEWLEMRKCYIGASDAPVIMGTSKWKLNDGRIKTPFVLWQEKLGLLETHCDNAATRFGKEMEGPALDYYAELKGERYEPLVFFHPTIPFLMASVDGVNAQKTKAVEVKNTNEEFHEMAKKGEIPSCYYPQLQHALEVLNFNVIEYLSCHKGDRVIVEVDRDSQYIASMIKKENEFWKYVEELTEPPKTRDDFIKRDELWEEKADRLWEIQKKRKRIDLERKQIYEEEKNLEKELISLSEEDPSYAGKFTFSYHTYKGSVNYKKIPELEGVDLDAYREKDSNRWVLSKDGKRASPNS